MVTESRARALRVRPQGLGDASLRPRAAARGGEGGWGGEGGGAAALGLGDAPPRP